MFVSIKRYMFRSFFKTIFRGSSAVLCAVTVPPADLLSLSLYKFNERKSAGGIVTAQSTAENPLKMVVKKTETCRDFILTNTFLTFYWV
jgi:hypothetical protein